MKNPHSLHSSIDTEYWLIEAAAHVDLGYFPFLETDEGLFRKNKHEPVRCW